MYKKVCLLGNNDETNINVLQYFIVQFDSEEI